MDRVKALGEKYEDALISRRRYLHEHAELSFQEENGYAWLHENLSKLDVVFDDRISPNSIIATIDSGKEGPHIGFRADYDALPILEENDLPFQSVNKGVMHACGHDAHAAILLTLAEAMDQNRDLLQGKVSFIFQQGEEKLPGGARKIIEEGGLEDMDCVYALHVRTNLNIGQFDAEPGARSSTAAVYEMKISGSGGHTGFPHTATDPMMAATMLMDEIYKLRLTAVDPKDLATIAVSYIHSDNLNTPNVYSKEITLGGTIRTLSNKVAAELPGKLEELGQKVCDMKGCQFSFKHTPGYASVENNGAYWSYVDKAGRALGYENVSTQDVMGAEDFSFMLLEKPGAYFTIGTVDPSDPRTTGARHTPNLFMGEKGIRVGFEIMLGTYLTTQAELEA